MKPNWRKLEDDEVLMLGDMFSNYDPNLSLEDLYEVNELLPEEPAMSPTVKTIGARVGFCLKVLNNDRKECPYIGAYRLVHTEPPKASKSTERKIEPEL